MKFLIATCILLVASVALGCPTITSRSKWGAAAPKQTKAAPMSTYVIIHHTAGAVCDSEMRCKTSVKGIQTGHMRQGWDDIGYNFVIDPLGNVYEGRGWKTVGSHAPKYNSKSIGISVIGDYTNTVPNSKITEAIKSLIQCGINLGKISPDYKLLGHRQTKATACPGDKLFNEIKTWPKWAAKP